VIALVYAHPEFRPRLTILPKVILAAIPGALLVLATDLPSLVQALLALASYALLIGLSQAVPEEIGELVPRPRRRRSG
jgi:hypothetical protein